jgi:uncharacterized protein (TIGR03032 family)
MNDSDLADVEPDAQNEPPISSPLRYVYSPAFADLLEQFRLSLLVSTYQAGKLMVVRARDGRLSILLRNFQQIMGLAADGPDLAIATRNSIWHLRDVPHSDSDEGHDACYLPRLCRITGDIRCHEIAYCGNELWLVNTRFNCLATLADGFSFIPRWRPPFITDLAAGDRCHLNGLCVVSRQPRYVTAHGHTNDPEGWRKNKLAGGVIIDVPTSQIVSDGLCMPHSPRWHDGHLYVLNSGLGELQSVDLSTGRRESITRLPGYARGLAFHDSIAFIALSTIREKREFGGVPVEQHATLQCAVHAVDLKTSRSLGAMTFQSGCTEIFDIQTLPGRRCPQVIGLEKETINDVFVMP